MVDRPPLVISGRHDEFLDWRRVGCSDHIHDAHHEAEQQAQEVCADCLTRTDALGCGADRK